MATTLKVWEHPQSGEKRIYINKSGLLAKVWLTLDENGVLPDLIRVNYRTQGNPAKASYEFPYDCTIGCSTVLDIAYTLFEKVMKEKALDCNMGFSELLQKAE